MEEEWDDESEPLSWVLVERSCRARGREAAKCGQVAVIAWIIRVGACGVGARPVDMHGGVLNFWDGSHARHETCTHVD